MTHRADRSESTPEATLRERLLTFLGTLDLKLDAAPDDTTPLVGSGILDSLGLVQLAIWIEGEIGHPIDPDEIDLSEEWNTVGNVVACIQRHRQT